MMHLGKISRIKVLLIFLQLLTLTFGLKKIKLELKVVNATIDNPGSIAYLSFNDRNFAAISEGSSITLWDIEKDAADTVLQLEREVGSISAKLKSGKLFIIDSLGGLIIHDFESNKRLEYQKGLAESKIKQIKITSEDQNEFILNVGEKYLLRCIVNKGCERAWSLNDGKYTMIEISKNSKTLFAVTSKKSLRLIDTKTGDKPAKEIDTLQPTEQVKDMVDMENRLFLLKTDGIIQEYSISSGERKNAYAVEKDVKKLFADEDNPLILLMGTNDNNIKKLTLTTKQISSLSKEPITEGRIEYIGKNMFLSSFGIWNSERGAQERAFSLKKKILTDELYFKYDSNEIIFVSKETRLLNVWPLRIGHSKYKYDKFHEIQCFDYNYNINIFYLITTSGKLLRYEEKWMNEQQIDLKIDPQVNSIHIIDYDKFAILYKNKTLMIYEEYNKFAEITLNHIPILYLRDLNGNRMLIVEKNIIQVFSFDSKTIEISYNFSGEATTAIYDETEGALLIGTKDGVIHVITFSIFDYTEESRSTIKVSEKGVLSLSFSKVSGQVGVLTSDGFFKIYEYNTRKLLIQRNLQDLHNIINLERLGFDLVESTFVIFEKNARVVSFWSVEEQKCQVVGCEDCYEDHTKCQKCEKGLFLAQPVYRKSGFFSVCEPCTNLDEFVQTVNDRKVCTKCNSKFKDCDHCKGEPLICTKCIPGKFLLYRNRSFSECVDCNTANYFKLNPENLDGSGVCKQCKESIAGCETCEQEGKVCLKCEINMGLSSKSKLKGSSNHFSECEQCMSKHQILDENTGVCYHCSHFIENCEFCYGKKDDCKKCKTGLFYYNGKEEALKNSCTKCDDDTKIIKGNVCLDCSHIYDNCKVCDDKDGCLECVPDFFIQVNKQEGIKKCSKCVEPGLIPDKTTNMCVPCYDILANCELCSSTPLTCHRCKESFYLLAELKGSMTCTKCDSPSYLISTDSNGERICQSCSEKFADCVECNPAGCSKCATGEKIYLDKGLCLKKTFNDKEKLYITFSCTISLLLLGSYIIYRKKYPLKTTKTRRNPKKDEKGTANATQSNPKEKSVDAVKGKSKKENSGEPEVQEPVSPEKTSAVSENSLEEEKTDEKNNVENIGTSSDHNNPQGAKDAVQETKVEKKKVPKKKRD